MRKAKFLNKKKVVEDLTKLSRKLKKRDKNIKKIILFGSLSEDTYTGLSDADLLIILKESNLRFVDRIPQLIFHFLDVPVEVDIFPYTEDEIENTPLAKRAIAKGIMLC